jgi:hypothetical protein
MLLGLVLLSVEVLADLAKTYVLGLLVAVILFGLPVA